MNLPVRRVALALAVVMAGFAVFALTMPRRKNLMVKWVSRRIKVERGCTIFAPGIFDDEDRSKEAGRRITEIQREGLVAMYDTEIGSIWYPTETRTLPALIEAAEADSYHLRSTIKPGDVVLDVGASVGTTTQIALSAGARRVVAIEPDPLTLECLEKNLSAEIREKKVLVVPKGVWDRDASLTLHLDPGNVGSASFVRQKSDESLQIPVTTIDRILSDLNITKVDLIKVHVEGAEKEVLTGATETIRRYHPRLAIVLEHHADDTDVLPA